MVRFEIETEISRSLEVVYKAFVRPENLPKYTLHLEKFDTTGARFGEVGAVAYLHYNQNGKKSVMQDKLLYLEEKKIIISEVSGEGIRAKVETLFHKRGEHTVMVMRWEGRGTLFLSRLFLPIFRKKIIAQAQKELEKFRELVEKYGEIFE